MVQPISTLGKYIMLMGRVFSRPERFKMYFKQYVNEMIQLGFNSIGIVLLISFFIGASDVIGCSQEYVSGCGGTTGFTHIFNFLMNT